MIDARRRFVQEDFLRPVLPGANAQFGLFTALGDCADASNAMAERSYHIKDLFAPAATTTVEVADSRKCLRQTAISTPDDPVEFLREPAGFLTQPERIARAPGPQHLGIETTAMQLFQPVEFSNSVIIEKGNKITMRDGQPTIASTG